MNRVILPIVLCLLIGALMNTGLSLWLLTRWPDPQKGRGVDLNLRGAALAGRTWPVRPPGAWPEPNGWGEWRDFGVVHVDAFYAPANQNTFAMEYVGSGWPMTTLYYRHLWWPWDDPQWKTEEPIEIRCRAAPVGWVANSAIFGVGLFALFFLAPEAVRRFIGMSRRARRLCPRCGYPSGSLPVCSECGGPVDVVITSAAKPAGAPPISRT